MLDAPSPTAIRWQPLRLGLIDLYDYDDEVFPFVDGRLLLRGNNGTGESKVLALTLPFLLDGDLSARRLEPDADPNERRERNLLRGGAHPHGERLGTIWIECDRRTDCGESVFCTLGAGLDAVEGRGCPGVGGTLTGAPSKPGSGNRPQPPLGHQREELQGRTPGPLLPPLPLTHRARSHVQVPGEDGLASLLAQPERNDLLRREPLDWGQAHVVERAHRLLVQ
jgi:hypothetical protein